MFVGHYAVSFALKAVDKNISLGMLFLAVQYIDILFFPLVLFGIEHFNLIENHTESTHFELTFMPYSHSLFATFVWAFVVYIMFCVLSPKQARHKTRKATILAVAVLSHWFLDLIVHTPDLPVFDNSSVKLGFGLSNNAIASYSLESSFLLLGLLIYLNSTKFTNYIGKYAMIIFVFIMLMINIINIFGPPFGNDVVTVSLSALTMYFLFASMAFWLDGKRQ